MLITAFQAHGGSGGAAWEPALPAGALVPPPCVSFCLRRSWRCPSQARGQPVRGALAPARSSVSLEVSTEDRVTLRPVFKRQSERR